MSDLPLPNISDNVVPAELAIPDIEDQIKQRWSHDKICSAVMTAIQTETLQGRPQIEITLDSEGARQRFWARIGEPKSNWILSRFLLPYVNEVKKAKGQPIYDFGTELMQDTLTTYLDARWVQNKMQNGINVRCITTVRDSTSNNSRRTVSLEFVHADDTGSSAAFESIKNLKQGETIARAKNIAKETDSNAADADQAF